MTAFINQPLKIKNYFFCFILLSSALGFSLRAQDIHFSQSKATVKMEQLAITKKVTTEDQIRNRILLQYGVWSHIEKAGIRLRLSKRFPFIHFRRLYRGW